MNPLVENNLTLILFLPWFLILSALFWIWPRQPRGVARRLYDLAAILASLALFVASLYWLQDLADPAHGRMWRHILATAAGYGVFLAAMLVAFVLRMLLFRRR
ncbi:hypothetical protein GCM10007164_10900 [Luteimonas padinae]|uniref:Transmembrane protein n=1 Tax=Luteimonas padinae TaxID=1714359 RepID=A0ABV6SSY1_9GAMM|nr:hypothetical protein [Luteimonas padinae]GHD68791.1 hypothetical protein GCM10007164_10900 [Luteimonas padinae]